MKTWDLAQVLETLARILRSSPSVELGRFSATEGQKSSQMSSEGRRLLREEAPNKQDLVRFINAYSLPIKVGSKDSSAAIKRKLRAFYDRNFVSKKNRPSNEKSKTREASPELINALSFLLGMKNGKENQR